MQFKTWSAGVNVTGVQITASGTGVQFKNLECRCKCDWRADHCKRKTGVQYKTWSAGVNVAGVQIRINNTKSRNTPIEKLWIILSRLGRMTGVQITASGTGVQFKNLECRCKCDWRAGHCIAKK